MSRDIYRNKKDFAVEEFATEIPELRGKSTPRESKSQKTQVETFSTPRIGRKYKKV